MSERVKVAVLGTGNIGTDLLFKLRKRPRLEVAMFAGVDPASRGVALAETLGVPTSTDGIDAILTAASDEVDVGRGEVLVEVDRRHYQWTDGRRREVDGEPSRFL